MSCCIIHLLCLFTCNRIDRTCKLTLLRRIQMQNCFLSYSRNKNPKLKYHQKKQISFSGIFTGDYDRILIDSRFRKSLPDAGPDRSMLHWSYQTMPYISWWMIWSLYLSNLFLHRFLNVTFYPVCSIPFTGLWYSVNVVITDIYALNILRKLTCDQIDNDHHADHKCDHSHTVTSVFDDALGMTSWFFLTLCSSNSNVSSESSASSKRRTRRSVTGTI